jgi:phosphatidate cytidylyltransferase
VFIPVYVFLAIPVVSALADDPQRFLERNAKLQWGIMVCIYGMSHVPALLLLDFRNYRARTPFLVFFLVLVVQTCMVVQHLVSRRLQARPPSAPATSASSFNWRSWLVGAVVASFCWAACWPASRRSSPGRPGPWPSSPASPARWATW